MEPEGSLPHSHVPATCPYHEPARSSPSNIPLHEDPSYYYPLILRLGLQSGLFPSGYPTNFDKAPRFLENLSTRGTCTDSFRTVTSSAAARNTMSRDNEG